MFITSTPTPAPKYVFGHADSAITDIGWRGRPEMRTNRIASEDFEQLIRLAFLLLPKIVIQGSSVANNRIFAAMYWRYGAELLDVLASSTEIVVEEGTGSFDELNENARERKAYGVPLDGDGRMRHKQWIEALDAHRVGASFHHLNLGPTVLAAQELVFSLDRVDRVDPRLAAKLSELEHRHGALAGNPTRTWFFELADTLAATDWRLAEDLRWMCTGALFLSLANASGGELVLPKMRRRNLIASSAADLEAAESSAAEMLQNTPLVKSGWLDAAFVHITFEMIGRLRASDEFAAFALELATAEGLPQQEGQARLRDPLNNYLNRIAYEIGQDRVPSNLVATENRLRISGEVSKWAGFTTTPVGIITSALPLVSSSLVFSPLFAVALGGAAMIFTGKRLKRGSEKVHREITEAGFRTAGLTTPVHIADLLHRL